MNNPGAASCRCELSIVLPCLNEAETLAVCIDKAASFLAGNNISGEIIVADNGSNDGSRSIAVEHGARVVNVPLRGYGAALMGGIKAAEGAYVVMADADDSYDLAGLTPFLNKLREGYDLVMGNRFSGGIKTGAMPFLNRYLGNPVLTGIGKLFFSSPVGDFHCGIRGFRKDSILKLDLQTSGMEFATEMIVKATLNKLRIAEVPTTLSPDGRSRPPHLKPWKDGWRHLRFLLIYSPRWLFLYPGAALTSLGLAAMCALVTGPKTISHVTFDIHTMLYAAVAIILGLQTVFFALYTNVFAARVNFLPIDKRTASFLSFLTLERSLIIGGLLSFIGIAGSVYAFVFWSESSFGPLVPTHMMRLTIPSLTLLSAGIQIIFSGFFLSILRVESK